MKTVMICACLDVILQNRWRRRLRKMKATRSLIQDSSTCEKFQFAIDEPMMNSPRIWSFFLQFTKTVVEQGWLKMNQKESLNLIKNWWRNLEKSLMKIWRVWENLMKFCYGSWELWLWLTNSVTISDLYQC